MPIYTAPGSLPFKYAAQQINSNYIAGHLVAVTYAAPEMQRSDLGVRPAVSFRRGQRAKAPLNESHGCFIEDIRCFNGGRMADPREHHHRGTLRRRQLSRGLQEHVIAPTHHMEGWKTRSVLAQIAKQRNDIARELEPAIELSMTKHSSVSIEDRSRAAMCSTWHDDPRIHPIQQHVGNRGPQIVATNEERSRHRSDTRERDS
jgi:hypothetical protein